MDGCHSMPCDKTIKNIKNDLKVVYTARETGEPEVEMDGASNKDAIVYLNHANEIYDYLSKLKERREKENARKKKREISEIKKVIKKTDSLVK